MRLAISHVRMVIEPSPTLEGGRFSCGEDAQWRVTRPSGADIPDSL